MQIKKIRYSVHFLRVAKKIKGLNKDKILKLELDFRKNPFNPKLKTHKLSGKLEGYWSFSINYQIRIMFKFDSEVSVIFLDIGSHDIYKK